MARTITFQPSPQMNQFIEGLVNSGDFNNQSEVIRAALRLLQEQNAKSSLKKLRDLVDEGDASDDVTDFSMEEIKQRLDKR